MFLEELRAHLSRHASLVAAGALLALSGNSLAQDDVEEAVEEAVAEAVADESIDEITVTGSRIKRTEFNTTAPIQVITSERSQLAGLLDTSEILQNSTVASGQQIDNSFSGFTVNGGNGVNSISLRGLGSQRTLVLVNGKRWGPSGTRGATNFVDLTAVPTSQIARYEILKDGASSLYGADAVAGVVNAITRQRVDASQINAQIFAPENGGESYSLDGIWGRTGDNWSFNVSAAYSKREATIVSEMPYAPCPTRPRLDGSNTDANGDPFCFGFIYGLQSGPFGFARYEPSLDDINDVTNPYYDSIQGTYGIPFWTRTPLNGDPNQGAYYRDTRDNDSANLAPEGQIVAVNSFGDYDFSIGDRSANAYYEFYYNKRESESSSGYRQFFPFVPASNPTNVMGDFGPLPGLIGQSFGVLSVLPSYNLQDPVNKTQVERTNTFIGLKGDISETWSYDTYIGHSWSDGTYEDDNWLQGQVDASLDAELDIGGNLVCSAASLALYPNCVAGNLFTEDALLRGILPQNYLDFIGKKTKGSTEYKQVQFSGYVTGDLFQFADRAVQAVFGVEWRNEEINDVPDIEAQNDNFWGFTTAGITAGDYDVSEAFTEIEIPILRDSPIAKEMTFNASWRYTDYSTYGGDDTYRLGFNWQITDLFRIRATQGTSFRAPALYELFLGNQTGFTNAFAVDVCVDYGTDYTPGTNIYDNCAAEGLAPDFPSGAGLPSVRVVTGGGADLKAETSDSWTAGIVLTPDALNTSFAINMFDIEINDTVARPSTGYLIFTCYNSPNKSSPFCNRVDDRDFNGYLTDVNNSPINIGAQRSRGIDYDIVYEKDFASFDLTIDVTATQLLEQNQELFGTVTDWEGRWGFPEWAAQTDVRIDYRDLTFFYNLSYVGSSKEEPVSNRICETKAYYQNNISMRYRSENNWELIGTIRNLLNSQPPLVSDGCGSATASRIFNTLPGAGYDLFGRAYTMQVSKGFDF